MKTILFIAFIMLLLMIIIVTIGAQIIEEKERELRDKAYMTCDICGEIFDAFECGCGIIPVENFDESNRMRVCKKCNTPELKNSIRKMTDKDFIKGE